MESATIIALITALAAIIAPVITAIINNKTNLKMKKIEENGNRLKSINLHERETLEKALSGIGILMSYKDADSVKESCKNILTAVAYVDSSAGEELRRIVQAVMNHEITISSEEYTYICNSLKDEISKRIEE